MLNHGVTFNLGSAKCVHLPFLGHISLMTKIYLAKKEMQDIL